MTTSLTTTTTTATATATATTTRMHRPGVVVVDARRVMPEHAGMTKRTATTGFAAYPSPAHAARPLGGST